MREGSDTFSLQLTFETTSFTVAVTAAFWMCLRTKKAHSRDSQASEFVWSVAESRIVTVGAITMPSQSMARLTVAWGYDCGLDDILAS